MNAGTAQRATPDAGRPLGRRAWVDPAKRLWLVLLGGMDGATKALIGRVVYALGSVGTGGGNGARLDAATWQSLAAAIVDLRAGTVSS